ncbi:MAG: hypothetical protein AAF436_00125 [Myxococcota bacterium]
MVAASTAKRRYLRQLLLSEIGESGQARLVAERFKAGATCDPGAYTVTADYLRRAGCDEDEVRGTPITGPTRDEVIRFAGSEALVPHAAAILGAMSAVARIKEATGAGRLVNKAVPPLSRS